MPDHAISRDARVQAQLDRLWRLSPGADVLGLERITALLARLGDPHLRLPPVFHVAGTNGKGSTCAYLRAALEAGGYRVHAYASPHLCRFNERIRLAGRLIDDAALAALLAEVLDVADGIGASFFEVTTAAAFLAFARTPAEACVIEVGLGGRLDATNVLTGPAATGIAALGLDHQAFLGDDPAGIAGEKAGIAEPGTPLVTLAYPAPETAAIAARAAAANTIVLARGTAWDVRAAGDGVIYRDALGDVALPRPALPGAHQVDNFGLAVAMLRHQRALAIDEAALAAAAAARWPARLQRLTPGPLVDRLPAGSRVWLDGAHNPAAAHAVAPAFAALSRAPRTLVLGVLANKDLDGILDALAPLFARVVAVPVEGHASHDPAAVAAACAARGTPARSAADVAAAFDLIGTPGDVLVAGSLYLAGTVLTANGEEPD